MAAHLGGTLSYKATWIMCHLVYRTARETSSPTLPSQKSIYDLRFRCRVGKRSSENENENHVTPHKQLPRRRAYIGGSCREHYR